MATLADELEYDAADFRRDMRAVRDLEKCPEHRSSLEEIQRHLIPYFGKQVREVARKERLYLRQLVTDKIPTWTTVLKETGCLKPGSSTSSLSELMEFPPELNSPTSRYRDPVPIARGGFGSVFKATRKRDGNPVAIKIPFNLDATRGEMFLDEADTWRNLRHDNIVKLESRNVFPLPHMELEWVNGGSLRDVLDKQKGPLELERAAWFVFQITQALKFAHSKGIFHLDLKPNNVMLTDDEQIKVTDWGLSKQVDLKSAQSKADFTLMYAAPEQIDLDKGHRNEATDIYQLGVTFFELVTGQVPFEGDHYAQILYRITTSVPEPPSSVNSNLKKPEYSGIDDLIMGCLAKEQSARLKLPEVQQRLNRILNGVAATGVEGGIRYGSASMTMAFGTRVVLTSAERGEVAETLAAFRFLLGRNRENLSHTSDQTLEVDMDMMAQCLAVYERADVAVDSNVLDDLNTLMTRLQMA